MSLFFSESGCPSTGALFVVLERGFAARVSGRRLIVEVDSRCFRLALYTQWSSAYQVKPTTLRYPIRS